MRKNIEVLGSFTSGWQSLHDAVTDDSEVAARDAALAALRDELGLIVNAEHLVVLAGLGTSLDIVNVEQPDQRAPTMADLWDTVAALPEFRAAQGELNADLLETKNFEHILSDAQARLSLDASKNTLNDFVASAEREVWKSCSFIDDKSSLETHELFLRKVARRSTRLQRTQLFTTNYDLSFELAARRARFNVIDGFGYGGVDFDGASFDLDYVRRRPNEQLALEPSVFHLLKLHGSVNWDSSVAEVRKVSDFEEPQRPVLIYPSAAKYQLSFQQPFLEFMSRFQIALRQMDVGLIVVGFGFNDEHLVAPIKAALRGNVGLRAIVVTPGARSVPRSESIESIESLIESGDRRLTLLNGTFGDLAKYLPDVPASDERELHMQRFSNRAPDRS